MGKTTIRFWAALSGSECLRWLDSKYLESRTESQRLAEVQYNFETPYLEGSRVDQLASLLNCLAEDAETGERCQAWCQRQCFISLEWTWFTLYTKNHKNTKDKSKLVRLVRGCVLASCFWLRSCKSFNKSSPLVAECLGRLPTNLRFAHTSAARYKQSILRNINQNSKNVGYIPQASTGSRKK